MGDLTENFSKKEMKCKCGCGICNVEFSLMNNLETLREYLGEPITVVSGCRCPEHNAAVGGKKTSAHITTDSKTCKGADIKSRNMFKLLQGALSIFERVGIRDKSIHVDVDNSKPKPRFWTYPA